MKNTIIAALSIAVLSASAQTSIAPPQAGFIQDVTGAFRPVYGFAGNFVIGDIVATAAVPDGRALFAFSTTGQPALVYVQSSQTLLQWNGTTFLPMPIDCASIAANFVWSIAAPDSDHAAFIIERDDGLWDVRVLLATGEPDSQTALPGLKAPAVLLASGDIVSRDSGGLVVSHTDGTQVHIQAQLPGPFSLQQMGDGWVHLRGRADARDFAVRITPGHEGFYALPEVRQ